ncbi:MAG TPA: right-handed parallel beta-helix repeat-containing protein [Methylocella sp.]|nr:right-handed parallel beta-helix repeat-containing protein [Methylocella sp.]
MKGCLLRKTQLACLNALICGTALFALPGLANATNYYVATTGSDSNPGTQSAPFLTITNAYSRAVAGDTINVEPGTYTDYTPGWGIYLNKSGAPGQQITLHSTVRGGAIVDGSASTNRISCFILYGTSYNTIDGFTIRNCAQGGISIYDNGSVPSTNNQFINNEIYNISGPDTGRTGQGGQGIQEGTAAATCNNYVGQNYIHDIGSAWDNTYDHGIYMECGGNSYVNNILVHNTHGMGLVVAGYYNVSNVKVYQNVMANNGTWGLALWTSGGSLTNVTVANNIAYGNQRGIAGCSTVGSGIVLSNNISYNNSVANYTQDGCGGGSATFTNTNLMQANPLFANANPSTTYTGNPAYFELQAGSPAMGAGMALPVPIDYAGNPRPSPTGWDIGAYNSNSGSTASSPTPAPTPAPTPTPASANLIQNGNFANGLNNWSNWGNASIGVLNGGNAVQVGPGAGGIGQSLTGLAAGNYTLTFAGMVSSSIIPLSPYDAYAVGVDFLAANGSLISEARASSYYTNTTWQAMTLPVAVPSNAYTVLVWVWRNAGNNVIYVSNFSLTHN